MYVVWMYGCMDVWMYVLMYVLMYVCIDVCMYVCMYVRVYTPPAEMLNYSRQAGFSASSIPCTNT